MARYWVGTDSNWNDTNNWSTTSGGAGGAGVPTSSDDVFFDGNGNAICQPTTAIVCKDFTLESTMTEMLLIEAGGVCHGDFTIDGGYFGPTGGGGYVFEFKGNWLKTGGTFAVGTGTGVDPTMLFSGTSKTYQLNDTGAATYQHLEVSSSYTFSGTRLGVANIAQDLIISGTMTIASGNRIDLTGDFPTLTGTIDGAGLLYYTMDASATIPATGTMDIDAELYLDASVTLPARTWEKNIEVHYEVDSVTLTLGAGKHYFNGNYKIYADNAAITTGVTLDCAANDAEFRCTGSWTVDINSFKQPSQFILNWGDGTHIFYDNFQLGVFGAATNMSMNAGDSTLIFRLVKAQIYTFRMSRVTAGFPGTYDKQTWNKLYFLRTQSDSGMSARFTEGFDCGDLRFEIFNTGNTSVRFRTWNALPQHDFTFDKMTLIGIDETKPFFGYPVLTGFGFHSRVTINDTADIFSVTICKWKCTPTVDAYNSELWVNDNGISSGFNFYDRDVQKIAGQRNELDEREKINATPSPELIIEKNMVF